MFNTIFIVTFFALWTLSSCSTLVLSSSSLEFFTFYPSNAILDPARDKGWPMYATDCHVVKGSINGPCLGWWTTTAEAKFQLPSSFTGGENNTVSFLYTKPMAGASYRRDTHFRVAVLSPTYPHAVEQYFDFSPKPTSLFDYAGAFPGVLGTTSIPFPLTIKPSSYISVKLVRETDMGAWNLFSVYLNHPSLPRFNEIDIKDFVGPVHGTTYNPAHTVSSSDFPRENTVNSLRFAATDCYSLGGSQVRLFRDPGSTSESENVGIGWWGRDGFISFIVPHDWVGFQNSSSSSCSSSSISSSSGTKSRKVKFIFQYARDNVNFNNPSMRIELRNSSAADELYGAGATEISQSSKYVRHQISKPGEYIVPPNINNWLIGGSKFLLATGEFDLTPNATLNITTYTVTTSASYLYPWNVFNVFAVPVELVDEFFVSGGGGGGGVPGVVPISPLSPTFVPTGSGSSSSSSSASANASYAALLVEYDELVERTRSVTIGLAVGLAVAVLIAIVVSVLYIDSSTKLEELEDKIRRLQTRNFQNHHGEDLFDPDFAAAGLTVPQQQHHQNHPIPTAGVVVHGSSANNPAYRLENNNNHHHHFQPQGQQLGYQRRHYHLDATVFANENVLNNSSPHPKPQYP